ncbi:McrB family protein [Urechidicola croceus]|nr:AAA family ATPase [Urechidicola croceus]
MLFDQVTKEHIIQGIKDYEEKGLPNDFGPSSTYDLVYNNNKYPPKAIMAYANYHAAGRKIERYFKGGLGTDCFKAFERNNFAVIKKKDQNMNENLYDLKQEFLTTWPIERLEKMKLEEYTNLEKTSFCYWIEHITTELGSVAGGSSYKFGIYKRSSYSDVKEESNRTTDGEYAWFKKYGENSKEQAFDTVKKIIVKIAQSAKNNNLELIDDIDLGVAYKWKIAFLYGEYNCLNIFKMDALQWIASELKIEYSNKTPVSYYHINILETKDIDDEYYEFSHGLWRQYDLRSIDVKKDFAKWLNTNTFESYRAYLGYTNKGIEEKLDEINNFFEDFDFYKVDPNKVDNHIKNILFLFSKKERIKTPEFVEYDLKNSNGIPKAILGKNNYIKFLNEKFEMKTNEKETLETLLKEFRVHIKGYADFTIKTYSDNFNLYLKNYLEKKATKYFDEFDYKTLSQISFSNYEKKTYKSQDHRGKGHVHFISFFKNKIVLNKYKVVRIESATNQIFYGPPGTGKTYYLKNELFKKYTSRETSITREQYFETVVSECSWWQVIAIALIELGRSKVSDIFEHEWVRKKASLSNSKTIRPTLWGQLQSHTIDECEFVNVTNRQQPLIFNKTADSYWEILEDQVEELVPELYNLKKSVENYDPDPDKIVKHFDFVTFHQSFSYEDFIEGIKPIMPENGEIVEDLGYKIVPGVFKEICNKAGNDPNNRYAIFIDEINRGNVSAIFGELITLIETDKRLGAKNELKIKLPYSKKEFGVPSNLDIYGTMNTADRSVEALDTALRRRFEFKEKMPDLDVITYEKVEGVKLSEVLKTINDRIELLIDRDHTIGHSYFINVDSPEKLANVFNNKIVPLLQEYFYGDYGKIGLVLGEGFVEYKDNAKIQFAGFKYEGQDDFKRPTFVLIKVEEATIIDAVTTLLGRGKTRIS